MGHHILNTLSILQISSQHYQLLSEQLRPVLVTLEQLSHGSTPAFDSFGVHSLHFEGGSAWPGVELTDVQYSEFVLLT